MAVRVQNTGYTGFYFRVLKEGWVSKESELTLLERHPKELSITYANRMMHHDKKNVSGIKRLLEVEELSGSWRKTLQKRLQGE